jgi:molecular chaperone DnaK (HSP70)
MILGIDYGTTRTVVAAADRGNYPAVSFQAEDGNTQEWYPSLIAARAGELRFGLDAAAVQDQPEWLIVHSFKRELALRGPESVIELAGRSITTLDLLTEFLAALRRDICHRSNLRRARRGDLDAMISVPANSNSNQRFNTLEAFKGAGFKVLGMINEPSAAGIEYAHHYMTPLSPEEPVRRTAASRRAPASSRENVVVYDLGGGTFDASVISMADRQHEVISSSGITRLGGDDFDAILLDLALGQASIQEVSDDARSRLLQECREKKEGLHPNTRRIVIDLDREIEGAGEAVVSASDFYERCRPLVEETIQETDRALESVSEPITLASVSAIYQVGGSSSLPVVGRLLRERYGRLVRRSPYPHASTAIGLAIAADRDAGYQLRERFTRHFGVWREAEAGRSVAFDVLFPKDTALPENGHGSLVCSRRYHPAHNVGRFRYLECSRVNGGGQPAGDITPWDEIAFPFDPALQNGSDVGDIAVARSAPEGLEIEERYQCDQNGIIRVDIASHTSGYSRSFLLHGGAATKGGSGKN